MVSNIYYTSVPVQAMPISILISCTSCTFLSPISALYDTQSIFYFYALRRHVDLRLASQEGLSLARRDSPVFLRIRPRCLKQRQSYHRISLSHCVSELSLNSFPLKLWCSKLVPLFPNFLEFPNMTATTQSTPFGQPMLKHWMFDPAYKNLNHGSFGAHPIPVKDAQRAFMDLADVRPDPYIRRYHAEHLDKAREAVAKLLNAQRDECVFVKNATTGVATVLYNLAFQPGEALIYFEPVYGAVEKGVVSLQEHSSLQARKVSFQFPITEDELERRFREVIRQTRDEGLKVRASVFDAIVSNPGVRFPFERITAICREEGILSVIDAAHGIGNIHLDMEKLQPDFFVSNCHKYELIPIYPTLSNNLSNLTNINSAS